MIFTYFDFGFHKFNFYCQYNKQNDLPFEYHPHDLRVVLLQVYNRYDHLRFHICRFSFSLNKRYRRPRDHRFHSVTVIFVIFVLMLESLFLNPCAFFYELFLLSQFYG